MNNEWYVEINNQRYGPLDINTLKSWIDEGRLDENDYIWNPSYGNDWRKISQIPELRPRSHYPPPPESQPSPPKPPQYQTPTPPLHPLKSPAPSHIPQYHTGVGGIGKQKIEEARRQRAKSDRIMSPLWILAPILAIVIYLFVIFVPLIAMFEEEESNEDEWWNDEKEENKLSEYFWIFIIIGFIIAAIIVIYPWYLLIKRRSEHFRRDILLREGIIDLLKEKSSITGVNINQEIATLSSLHAEASSTETYKNPVVYIIIMIVIPWIGAMYVLYFLMKDIYAHHNRVIAFMYNTQSAINRLGNAIVAPTWKTLPSRSFAVYFILSCCVPFFGLYWEYTIIKDYNDHFKAQWQFEDQLPIAY